MVLNGGTESMDPSIFYIQGNFNQKMADAHRMKRSLTLNLENPDSNIKRSKYNAAVDSPAPLLSSPDVNKFNLSTPDIMKLFPGIGNAKTPSTPSLFVRGAHEDYSQSFDAFDPLKTDMNNSHAINDPLSSNDFMNIENQYPSTLPSVTMMLPHENIPVKEEPQTLSSLVSSPRLSPINMDTQEAIKLERKRSRNRLAASKCRRRKLERIAKLEDKVKLLKGENGELNQLLSRLKAQVYNLKQKVVKHYNNGCLIGH